MRSDSLDSLHSRATNPRITHFGPDLSADGVRFSLWAPGTDAVTLLVGERLEVELTSRPNGWFEAFVPGLRAGARYAFRLPGGQQFADPASRFQPDGWRGMSEVADPDAYRWATGEWRGRPWHEAVIYELHVGAFTPAGTFTAACARLDELVELGVTAIELMPLGEFPGGRGWGYDGVLLRAPKSTYGRPEELKALIDAAHARRLMVLLDVVFNHFGPEGNLLGSYAPGFFDQRLHTPWGAAINFAVSDAVPVRDFFVQTAVQWVEEYRFDGLRFDAVHTIVDDSEPHVLEEIAAAIRQGPGRDRQVHLVLENDANQAQWLRSAADNARAAGFDAQWNDDLHHVLHYLLTGESHGYYQDYADTPIRHLGRCLTEGFAFQGEWSGYRRARRGEPSAMLAPSAFVVFLQNHDQIGNRAFGERIGRLVSERRLRVGVALLLLAPSVPLLFMGEEWNASSPFLYFCDFEPELAARVCDGRRAEFVAGSARDQIPDPNRIETFAASRLRWSERFLPAHVRWLEFYRGLLRLRSDQLVPQLASGVTSARFASVHERALCVEYGFGSGARLRLEANFDEAACSMAAGTLPLWFATPDITGVRRDATTLPGWSFRAYFATHETP